MAEDDLFEESTKPSQKADAAAVHATLSRTSPTAPMATQSPIV